MWTCLELWDILDANGNLTGKVIERGGVLDVGEYYLGVHIYIVNDEGNFLIQKRAKCKRYFANIWDLNMGHAISGETSKQAAIREISEEIGVELDQGELKFVKRFIWEKYNHIIDIWLVHRNIDISSTVMQKEEVSDLKYISKNELMELLMDMSANRPSRPSEYVQIISTLK